LGAWDHAQFLNASKNIDRLLGWGDLPAAYAAAQKLLGHCKSAGADAYFGATYDIACVHLQMGKVLRESGDAERALSSLAEASRQFQALADAYGIDIARMPDVITERAACLCDLGRYEEAAAAYEESVQRAERLAHRREAAVGKANLGTVRMFQKRYAEALERYAEALKTFESLGEPGSVATIWHQIGIVHRQAKQFGQAEQSYRQSLSIKVQHKLRADEAATLVELGSLYKQMGRPEDAATFYRQASEIYSTLQNLRYEGASRSGLAAALITLQRYDEARHELLRAIECLRIFSHAATIWNTWDILHDLEQATGNAEAAAEARGQAVASYLAYRRAGGESQSDQAGLFAMARQTIQKGTPTESKQTLDKWVEEDNSLLAKTLVASLRAILGGDRSPLLAEDPDLTYMHAVELQLLLEALSAK
jgi:tetratricopeptide (TPR) repeat protein